jgi:hypothetical protein
MQVGKAMVEGVEPQSRAVIAPGTGILCNRAEAAQRHVRYEKPSHLASSCRWGERLGSCETNDDIEKGAGKVVRFFVSLAILKYAIPITT